MHIRRLKVLLKYIYILLFQQFEQDVRDHVESTLELSMPLLTEVSEVTRRVTLKGDRVEVVGKWLLDLGFWTIKFYKNKYIYTHLHEYVCLVRISWSRRTIISMMLIYQMAFMFCMLMTSECFSVLVRGAVPCLYFYIIIYDSPTFKSRWQPLLKINTFTNDQKGCINAWIC